MPIIGSPMDDKISIWLNLIATCRRAGRKAIQTAKSQDRGMRVNSIEILVRLLANLWPVSFPDAKQLSSRQAQYQAVLDHLSADELNAAYHVCMIGWTKKAAPLPADILKAHLARSLRETGSSEIFIEPMRKHDADFEAEKHRLIDSWMAEHPATVTDARQEGWLPNLSHQLALSANILAQRNMIRLDPRRRVPSLSPDDATHYGIVFEGDQERLVVTTAMIETWRFYRLAPDTPVSEQAA
jgi:hypothetical protein